MPLSSKAIFAYQGYPVAASQIAPKGSVAYRPVVFARLSVPEGRILEYPVLLDTGADHCLFPTEVAKLLKLNLLAMPKSITTGFGNQRHVTFHAPLTIHLGKDIRFTSEVGFTAGLDGSRLAVLGQSGFFDAHHVEFRHPEGIFTIEAA